MTSSVTLRATTWTISAAVWSVLIVAAFSMGMKLPELQFEPKPNDPIDVVTLAAPPAPIAPTKRDDVRIVEQDGEPVVFETLPVDADPRPPVTVPTAGAASGPPVASPPLITSPRWLSRPGAREFERFYPVRARERGREGRVTLDCVVRANGAIACVVANETPREWGFGEAALKMAPSFRIAPRLEDGRASEGGTVRVDIAFRMDS